MRDALLLLLRVNLAASVAVLVVMLLRRPVRRLFGARIAYGLWALVALAAVAMLAPPRIVRVNPLVAASGAPVVEQDADAASPDRLSTGAVWPDLLAALWLGGAAAAGAHLIRTQARFARAARRGQGGPAVIGVLRPRIVTPADFARRYTPREQGVVLAHEAMHIARQDPRINGLVALARCVNWFNPLVHVLAHHLRIDQELACDAQVVAAHPAVRRSYAEAMLKTQLAARPLPLGCYWPAPSAHPLAERIGLLTRPPPGLMSQALGGVLVAALTLGGSAMAWAVRPADLRVEPAPPQATTPTNPPPTPIRVVDAAPLAPHRAAPAKPAPKPRAADLPAVLTLPDPGPLEPAPPPPQPGERTPPVGRGGFLPAGFFGPGRVHSAAGWSQVAPGSAVRVVATMTDPQGIPLVTDLTAFGSQSRYRIGYVARNASPYRLFTRVVQKGDRLLVTAALNQIFRPMVSGDLELRSGETGTIRLPNGLIATVTPTLRAETPEEIAEANRMRARYIRVDRVEAL